LRFGAPNGLPWVISSAARPSTIGEILDRAIATYIRRFLALFVILAVIAVPITIAMPKKPTPTASCGIQRASAVRYALPMLTATPSSSRP
jgi:hypothetical protein